MTYKYVSFFGICQDVLSNKVRLHFRVVYSNGKRKYEGISLDAFKKDKRAQDVVRQKHLHDEFKEILGEDSEPWRDLRHLV